MNARKTQQKLTALQIHQVTQPSTAIRIQSKVLPRLLPLHKVAILMSLSLSLFLSSAALVVVSDYESWSMFCSRGQGRLFFLQRHEMHLQVFV